MKRLTQSKSRHKNHGFSTIGFILNLALLGLIVAAIAGEVEWGTVGLAAVVSFALALLWGFLVGRLTR
jgi:hypothetical protein